MADKDGKATTGQRPCYAMFHTFGPNGEVRSFPADQGTQERWEGIRQLILGKLAERAARMPKREPVETGPMLVRRAEPGLFDVAAWQRYLAEYEGDDPTEFRDAVIEYAKAHLAVISCPAAPESGSVQEMATEPRSDAG